MRKAAQTPEVFRTISVGLVDDHEAFRRGVSQMLGADTGISVAGEASNAREAKEMLREISPDVALVDIRLGDGSGIDVIRATRTTAPNTKSVMLSAYDDIQYVTSLVKEGAVGYLLKTVSGADLRQAVHAAAEGKAVLAPEIAGKVLRLLASGNRRNGSRSGADRRLTATEADILGHLSQGVQRGEIAVTMGISTDEVEAHLLDVMQKLGAGRTRASA